MNIVFLDLIWDENEFLIYFFFYDEKEVIVKQIHTDTKSMYAFKFA